MEFHEYDVISRFPLLRASEDFKKWSGFISTALGKTILLSLAVPEFPGTAGIKLVTEDLNEKAKLYWTPLIEQIPNEQLESFSLLQYLQLLEELQGTGTTNPRDEQVGQPLETPELYSKIIEEIEAIGIKHVVSLSRDFKKVAIKHVDKSGRDHFLKLALHDGYPNKPPTVQVELPLPSESIKWPGTIQESNKMFMTYLDTCCKFWDDMEDLDSLVRVVDPVQPTKGHFHRRILLEENVIIHLVFDALAPRALPQISFAGPEKYVEAFNASVDHECNMWDESMTVIQNLKSILNCEFVMKECAYGAEDVLDDQAACTVCYVYNFEEEIPDIACDCGSVYHRQCLHDLFVSNMNKTNLRLCVECPSCQKIIKISPQRTVAGGGW